jgi:hypothetical protein
MTSAIRLHVLAAVASTGLSLSAPAQAQQATMSFFVTSVGKGNGADLGGLAGADAHCQALAKAAGSTETNWRAYLSTTEPGGVAGVNARDRIGKGPWQNSKGIVVAKSVEDFHSDSNNINKQTALTENGDVVSGRGDAINMHDILTGSDPQGLYSTAGGDTTCGNWTKSSEGSAIVGHHDRIGLKDTRHMSSWNSSHGSRGCIEGYGRRRPDLLFLGQLNAPRAGPLFAHLGPTRAEASRLTWAMCGRLRVGKGFLHECSIGRCGHVFGLN